MDNLDFDKTLDVCLDRINRGETIELCLAKYPEHAVDLKPLLETAAGFRQANSITVSDDARRRARKLLFDAVERHHQPSFWAWIAARAPGWGTAISILLLAAIGLLNLHTVAPSLGSIPIVVATTPTPIIIGGVPQPVSSNFRFMVSDAPNDIGDFTSLIVTVDHVMLLKKGNGDTLITFTPEVKDFDLVKLPGSVTQQLWQGNVPEGEYTHVDIYISHVTGTLKNGKTASVKLPGDTLQISVPFIVGTDKVTTFTFDITVNKTGEGAGKYILKPQADTSGAHYSQK